MESIELKVKIEVDTSEIDIAIQKANQLLEILRESQEIINSLNDRELLKF